MFILVWVFSLTLFFWKFSFQKIDLARCQFTNTNLEFTNRITDHILFNAISIFFLRTQKVFVEFIDRLLNEFGFQIFKRSIHPNVIEPQPYFAQPFENTF